MKPILNYFALILVLVFLIGCNPPPETAKDVEKQQTGMTPDGKKLPNSKTETPQN